ncbi:hypothetical protein F4810DRAFT_673682 [Camillea tinctor]|nr:hypothetical protein F4810DRAFT_673682 [Camillea tinctor]
MIKLATMLTVTYALHGDPGFLESRTMWSCLNLDCGSPMALIMLSHDAAIGRPPVSARERRGGRGCCEYFEFVDVSFVRVRVGM